MKKIATGRVDIVGAHTWFKRAEGLPDMISIEESRSQGNTWDFFKVLVDLTLPKPAENIPHTFLFDEERLIKLRSDMLDLINLEICMHIYRSLEPQRRPQPTRYMNAYFTPVTSSTPSPPDHSIADDSVLSSPTIPSEQDFQIKTKYNSRAQERGHFRTEVTGRQIWVLDTGDETMESQASSPHSSPVSITSTPQILLPVTPLYLSKPPSDSASQVRSSLLALLASSPSNPSRWSSLSSSLALQILRSTPGGLNYVPHFESQLASHLSNPNSSVYREAQARVLSQLLPVLQKLVETYSPLTSFQIFEAATAPKAALGGGATSRAGEEITEIAKRIAHIGILHWRVWAPLAYLVDPDTEAEVYMNGNQGEQDATRG